MYIKPAKPFLNYEQQVENLKNKGVIISNKRAAIHSLRRNSYFSLIYGYKHFFKDKATDRYKQGVTFEDIMDLYHFDEELRILFLQYLLILERKFKSIYSYEFCLLYGDSDKLYRDVHHYDFDRYRGEVKSIVSHICDRYESTDNQFIAELRKQKRNIPLWATINILTFGNVAKMYDCSKQQLQSRVSRNFQDVYPKDLKAMLNVLTQFRNVCAHSEKLYDYRTKESITNLEIHHLLQISKIGNTYQYGKQDLFSVVIAFKYLLDKEDFNHFFIHLSAILQNYATKVSFAEYELLLKLMGFPPNWNQLYEL